MKVSKKRRGNPKLLSDSHRRAPKQEAELAKRIGGRITAGSGCGNEKGDVRLRGVLRIEAKTTKNKSFSVTRQMIRTVCDTAVAYGELPAMIIEFLDGAGKPEMEVAIVPTYVLNSIISNE